MMMNHGIINKMDFIVFDSLHSYAAGGGSLVLGLGNDGCNDLLLDDVAVVCWRVEGETGHIYLSNKICGRALLKKRCAQSGK